MAKKNVITQISVEQEDYSFNEACLRGRISGQPSEKVLPSGDRIVELRLVIAREGERADSRSGVDTLDIAAWSYRLRKRALSLKDSDWVQIDGPVHRRFWQGAHGVASRWQIEAFEITRL
ncbi:unannotated protein [freshwater metagenome]|uniref:Unannotated protein n=1 Tax=freshwater metagenome TaxID=449393 RepID=A0A6J7XQ17_9ZZZZ|nr:single-stranded DNA-binding protein [Actinomycetota bacterium]